MTAADNDKRADESRPLTKSRWLYRRNWVQIAALLVMNSYFFAWAKGFCVPALNCWACPGAIFGCPLGAIQNSSISARWTIGAKPWYAIVPFYVIGVLFIFSAIFGRMMCGWICPFGWLQDKLAALRRRHWRIPKPLRYLRYVLLVVLVLIVPYLTGTPWFCKLCPQGALQGGWLQPIFNPETRALIGTWWWIKQAILVAFILLMIFVKRPFCGAICPLGAIFSLFQRYSLWRIDFDADKCVNCMWCVNECPAGIDPRTEVNNHDCIGCLECTKCPYGAIQSRPIWAPPPAQKQVTEA
jgi:ferredoxin-type protein NapH